MYFELKSRPPNVNLGMITPLAHGSIMLRENNLKASNQPEFGRQRGLGENSGVWAKALLHNVCL